MNKIYYNIYLLLLVILTSCSNSINKDLKIKYLGGIYNGFTGGPEILNDTNIDTPIYRFLIENDDTTQYIEINKLFNEGMKYTFKNEKNRKYIFEISNETIRREIPKIINEEKVCCDILTQRYFIEKIDKKNYLFLIYESGIDYYEIDSNQVVSELKRDFIDLPTWNVNLGSSLPENKFKEKIEINELKFIEYKRTDYKQIFKENPSLKITTLKYPDLNDRVITRIKKSISKQELEEFLNLVKLKYGDVKIGDTTYYDDIFKEDLRKIEFNIKGFYVKIDQIISEHLDSTEKLLGKNFEIEITDVYEVSKTLIKRREYKSEIIYSEKTKTKGDIKKIF